MRFRFFWNGLRELEGGSGWREVLGAVEDDWGRNEGVSGN